jgi:hypothetical protein
MTRQQRLLSQLRKLEEKLVIAHDDCNDARGPADKMTQTLMYCYVMALSSVMEAEAMAEDDGGFGEG